AEFPPAQDALQRVPCAGVSAALRSCVSFCLLGEIERPKSRFTGLGSDILCIFFFFGTKEKIAEGFRGKKIALFPGGHFPMRRQALAQGTQVGRIRLVLFDHISNSLELGSE